MSGSPTPIPAFLKAHAIPTNSFFSYSSGWKEDNGIIGAMFDVLAKRTNYIETRVLMDIFLYSVRLVKNKL